MSTAIFMEYKNIIIFLFTSNLDNKSSTNS
jgi:hypothetical protein